MTSKSFGVKNIDVSNNLNVSGVGTFTTGLDLDGYLKDVNDQQGSNGQILTSTGDGVSWSNISTDIGGFDDAVNDLIVNNEEIPYGNITGTPTLATVASSGAYSDLTGTPTHTFLGLTDTPSAYNNGKLLVSTSSGIGFTDTTTLTKLVVSGPLVEKFIRIDCSTESSPINVSLDLSLGNVFQIVLKNVTDTHTISFTNCPASESNNEAYSFTVIVTNTRNNTVVQWPNYDIIKWAGNPGLAGNADDSTQTVPTRSTKNNKSDVWVFTTYDGGTTFLGVLASFGYHGLPTS